MVALAAQGSIRAAAEIFDRVHGKSTQFVFGGGLESTDLQENGKNSCIEFSNNCRRPKRMEAESISSASFYEMGLTFHRLTNRTMSTTTIILSVAESNQ
jgi:hypothetical protein